MLRHVSPLIGLVLLGCGAAVEPPPRPARPPGTIRLGQVLQSSPSPHLTEVLIRDPWVFVGNSNDAFAVYELEDDGGLELVVERPSSLHRCTTLALHEPTDSLYCASDERDGVFRYDVGDPLAPVADADAFNPLEYGFRAADLVVVGEQLLVARYDLGLATAQIGADGQLSQLREQPELGKLRKLAVDEAERVWALTTDRGLLVLERGADEWIERFQLDVDGPALGLGVDGSRGALGLGSAGLWIVELDASEGLKRTHALAPPGVVTAADLSGDAAVAVTLFGVFAYDLREPESWPADPRGEVPREAFTEAGARMAGFGPAGPWGHMGGSASMLDGALVERDGELGLITSDWTWVERWAIDIDGFPRAIDLRRGEYLAAEAETVTVALRNPTPFELRVEYAVVGEELWSALSIGPRATVSVSVSADRFEIDTPQLLRLRVWDGDELVDTPGVTVLRRAPESHAPVSEHGRPAPGAAFLPITLATGWPGEIEPSTVPTPGFRQRVVFYGLDCAAMWPEVEDLLWRVRSGRLRHDEVVLASRSDPTIQGTLDMWGLDDARWGYFAPGEVPQEIAEQNPFEDLYEDGFVIYELPSAAHHPTDYVVDGEGVVVEVEREYRGEHALAAMDPRGRP